MNIKEAKEILAESDEETLSQCERQAKADGSNFNHGSMEDHCRKALESYCRDVLGEK